MKVLCFTALMICSICVSGVDVLMKNGVKIWNDRVYVLNELPAEYNFKKTVPAQHCSQYNIVFPAGTQKALVAICSSAGAAGVVKKYDLKSTGKYLYIGNDKKAKLLKYDIFAIENPPEKIDCRPTRAGGILLAVNDDVQDIANNNAPQENNTAATPAKLSGVQSFEGQEYRFQPGKRMVEYYVRAPQKGINANTGLMLVSHNWGGTWKYTAPWCDILSDRFNLICLSVNYLQSGETRHDKVPYDHGLLQAMDCLRALYEVIGELERNKIKFNSRRIYAAGASGGGNISLMVNKLAPNTFGCIIDLCGMPGLTNNIAFGIGALNAGYSRDPRSPKYLTAAMQEIRDPGNPAHLSLQKKWQPANKAVIVHGLDDKSCDPADKMVIAANMVRAGFRPDTHFLTANDVDGSIVKNTGHAIGNRPEVISKFGREYIAENGKYPALNTRNDFTSKHEIVYPVTGGKYIISFKTTPTIRFEK